MGEPGQNCRLCPRLRRFILDQRARRPGWHNAPVRSFLPPGGEGAVRLLIVGLAPGLKGANRTGRPFTGDHAGHLLYDALARYGFSRGTFRARTDDGLELAGAAITNAVRCVPPGNRPSGAEINTCRRFLVGTLAAMPRLRVVVALGRVAHDSTVRALGGRAADYPFGHNASTRLAGLTLISSYHCSGYNTRTGRLTEAMFMAVFEHAAACLEEL